MQSGFMPERFTIDAMPMQRRLQEEHNAKEQKLHRYLADLHKAFDRVLRKA